MTEAERINSLPFQTLEKTRDEELEDFSFEKFIEYLDSFIERTLDSAKKIFAQAAQDKEISANDTVDQERKLLMEKFRVSAKWLIPLLVFAKISKGVGSEFVGKNMSSYSRRIEATQQLETTGITDERELAYAPGVSEVIYRAVPPLRPYNNNEKYDSIWSVIKYIPTNLFYGENGERRFVEFSGTHDANETYTYKYRKEQLSEREDAWRLYLGLPQEYSTFGISEYQPSESSDDKYYYKINNWLSSYKEYAECKNLESSDVGEIVRGIEQNQKYSILLLEKGDAELRYEEMSKMLVRVFRGVSKHCNEEEEAAIFPNGFLGEVNLGEMEKNKQIPREQIILAQKTYRELMERKKNLDNIKSALAEIEQSASKEVLESKNLGKYSVLAYDGRVGVDGVPHEGVMGKYRLSLGEDESGKYLSYYDNWDNLLSRDVSEAFIGNPYEIYDRIYYDSDTYKVVAQENRAEENGY